MQSHPIKFKCGHERALPLDERGEALKIKIWRLSMLDCRERIEQKAKQVYARTR